MDRKDVETLAPPQFLKFLTTPPVSLSLHQALSIATILLPKGYNSVQKLKTLSPADLERIGITDPNLQKALFSLSSPSRAQSPRKHNARCRDLREMVSSGQNGKRKRDLDSDLDKPLPVAALYKNVQEEYDFEEILNVDALMAKSVIINRAPVMMAWAVVVAERLGFNRREALSIAHVFTSLNAAAKAKSLGKSPKKAEEVVGRSQPFVMLMNRKIPLIGIQIYQRESDVEARTEWRALGPEGWNEENSELSSSIEPIRPSKAFAYIKSSFHQQTGVVIGAFKILAESYSPQELNEPSRPFELYCRFRPGGSGDLEWGKKARMNCKTILDLRKGELESEKEREAEEPPQKRSRIEKDVLPDTKSPSEGGSKEKFESTLDAPLERKRESAINTTTTNASGTPGTAIKA